jgi:homoserine kinase type II
MAVKTTFSNETIQNILRSYTLGDLIKAEPIAEGTVQTNYKIITTKTTVVLRCYENKPIESVLFEMELLNSLTAKGFPTPRPIPNKTGDLVFHEQNKPCALFPFASGAHFDTLNPSQQLSQMQTVAQLNKDTIGYESAYTASRCLYAPPFCREMLEKIERGIDTENSRKKKVWFLSQLSSLSLPDSLPKAICHCDAYPYNILFEGDRLSALLDFDQANITYACYDLALLLPLFVDGFDWDTWEQFDRSAPILDFDKAKMVLSDYETIRPLSTEERYFLFDVVKLTVLFDCLWYFERGNADDFFERRKIETLNQLGRNGFYEQLFSFSDQTQKDE